MSGAAGEELLSPKEVLWIQVMLTESRVDAEGAGCVSRVRAAQPTDSFNHLKNHHKPPHDQRITAKDKVTSLNLRQRPMTSTQKSTTETACPALYK